jgi:5-methylcytosine-specific restriction endonuclease McrA
MNQAQRRHLRWLLFGQQEGKCFYYRKAMALSFAAKDHVWDNAATLENLHRRADGGKGGGNLVLACRECNQRRGDRPWADYRVARLA